jgi:hypothetical protein
MTHNRSLAWLAALVLAINLISGFTSAIAAPLAGTRAIGPTGDYVSITAALADAQAQTLGGALVWELQTNYVSSVETFPLVFGSLTTTAANTLTLRPQLGATNLLISSAVTTAATVDLNGAQFVTIDGRPGGMGGNAGSGGGAASQLTIANTSIAGRTLRFINGAGNNTLRYTTLHGANNNSFNGVVYFSTTTSAYGNDTNTLDHCDIGNGASNPANCIYSTGYGAPKNNRGNTVSNCNIFNFFSTGGDQYGIRLDGGNSDWTITGNNFYQTDYPAATPFAVGAIFINDTSGNNFVVCSNTIGGWANSDTPAPAAANLFFGIKLNVGSTTPSSVQGNTIQNMYWMTTQNLSAAPGIWGGITVLAGSANIGTVSGNSFNAITVVTSGTGALATGITSTGTNTVAIANNNIYGMTVSGTTTLVSASFTGIEVTAGTNIIYSNVEDNFHAPTASTSLYLQALTGIYSSSSNSTSITGNTVDGFYNSYAGGGAGQVHGILATDGVNAITGNSVYNLNLTSGDGNDGTFSSVLGIGVASSQPGQTVSQNTVDALYNTTATAAVVVTGILYAGPASGTNLIARNRVDGLAIYSTNTLSVLLGMDFVGGSFTAQNNMVCVGLRAGGYNTGGASLVFGIYDDGQDDGRNFYHNSVYVGGAESSNRSPTAALYSWGWGNVRAFQNNLFVNVRSKGSGTGSPYAVYYRDPILGGLTAGGNVLLASGTGGVLGHCNTNDYATLAGWQAATGQDATSLNVDPLYVNPGGAPVDLHVAPNSPAINAGLPIGVTNDFDGNLRSTATPTIGADEYIADYTLVPGYNQISGSSSGGGTNALAFQGLPGSNYALEMATNLVPPVVWQPLLTNGAAVNGSLFFTNVASQSPVFYRARYIP